MGTDAVIGARSRQDVAKDLGYYVRAFSKLHANLRGMGKSPHKPVLLLALMELFESGSIKTNRFEFCPELVERFAAIFGAVRQEGDQCNPVLPFYHLKSDGFWHLKARPEFESILGAVGQIKTQRRMSELVESAYLDAELFHLLVDPSMRAILRETLLTRWFSGTTAQSLNSVLTEERQSGRYQQFIRDQVETGVLRDGPPEASEPARDRAFARCVRAAYDYRCAACGWRVLLPDGRPLVEAAHLLPFGDTQDDDPRNGIALSPTYHELMDANVIAPGPDLNWHISPLIDPRIPDHRDLCVLAGRRVLLPNDRRYYPRRDALEWRLKSLAR